MTRHWRGLPRSLELRRWIRWRYFTGEGWRLRSHGRVIGMHLNVNEIFRGLNLDKPLRGKHELPERPA